MQKLMDHSKMKNMGWTPKTDFKQGLAKAYTDYLEK
jgi:nucleoside-diphosphate-sugar epimerase